jgi:hypothetical protein
MKINAREQGVGPEHHPPNPLMGWFGNGPAKNRRARRNMKADDLEKHHARRRQHRVPKMAGEQGQEKKPLHDGKQIIGPQPIENNLPPGERAGEQELDIGGLKYQPALQKSFEQRAATHDQRRPDQALAAHQLLEGFVTTIPKTNATAAKPMRVVGRRSPASALSARRLSKTSHR